MFSPIAILPVEESDFSTVARLEVLAFSTDAISVYGFGPNQDSPAAIEKRVQSLGSTPPGCVVRMRKAVTQDNQIVGFTYWKFYYEPRIPPSERVTFTWPEGAIPELCDAVFGRADRIRDQALNGKRYAALNVLVVSPDYQRRGIGAQLINEGLEEADRNNMLVWLGASEPALKLYKRVGFNADEVIEIDMRKYGGSTIEKHISMTRPAARSENRQRLCFA